MHLVQENFPHNLHPLEELAATGQAHFFRLLRSQSNTLGKAITEYVRRYDRYPPPGFDKWFAMAQREEYVLFDEFDTVMETLEPFWGIAPQELRNRVDAAFEDPLLIKFSISNAIVTFENEGWAPWMGVQVQSWLPPEWRRLLSNMTFAINILDEPRVLAPFDVLREAVHHTGMSRLVVHQPKSSEENLSKRVVIDFKKVDRENAWRELAVACNGDAHGWYYHSKPVQPLALEFVHNTTDMLDVCSHPWLHKIHGLLSSPDSLDITNSLVPIFSQGKLSIFNDVLFPSPYYSGKMDQEEYIKEEDPDWSKNLILFTGPVQQLVAMRQWKIGICFIDKA